MVKITHMLKVDQLDKRLAPFRSVHYEQRNAPKDGWIATIRKALGMSGAVLAKRMGVSQPAEAQYEKSERDSSISLQTLEKIADALDADLVYTIVPRMPIREILEKRAKEEATKRVLPLAHSMGMESQATSNSRLEQEIADLQSQLLARPKELWR